MDAEGTVERFVTVDTYQLAVTLFLISEGAFFAFLIIAYVYFHGSMTSGPNASNSLNPLRTGIYSVFLLASSFTVRTAEHRFSSGRRRAFAGWLLTTILLGTVFLVGQAREYFNLYRNDVTVSRNVFGTSFFTLTGFHGLHVLLGLLALCILFALALAGEFETGESDAIRVVALYWHFVDWIWVVIFFVVYVWALF
ncbi:MAG: cytochrome c oxidase subunit 3 [Terriglobales bacterium]